MSTYDFTNLTENDIREIVTYATDQLSDMARCVLGREYVIAIPYYEGNLKCIEWCLSVNRGLSFLDYNEIDECDGNAEYIRIKSIESFKRIFVDIPNDKDNGVAEYYIFKYNGNTYISPDTYVFAKLIDDAF